MRFFVDDLQISPFEDFSMPILIGFSCPQMTKFLKHDLQDVKPAILLYFAQFKSLIAAIPSPNFTLHFEAMEFVPQFLSVCECKFFLNL
jgi:hypothetical protein